MPLRKLLAVTAIILCPAFAPAKDKKKAVLPADVLHDRTVLVIVDPTAGVDVRDPNANRVARADVEKALDQWGRFTLVQEGLTADLVITVRKGNGKLIQPTIGGTPINGTPPVSGGTTSSPTQTTTRAGVRWGTGNPNDPANAGTQPSLPSRKSRLALRRICSSFIAEPRIRPRLHSMPRRCGGIQAKMRSHRLRFQRSRSSAS